MRRNRLILLTLVAASAVALAACSKHELGVEPRLKLEKLGGAFKPDSTPHPTPRPDTTVVEPIVFVAADSVQAGSTGISRWIIGNSGKKPFTSSWILTADPSWPGYPIQGTVHLGPLKTQPLNVTFPVPASAFSGVYQLRMAVTAATVDTSIAYGFVRVYGNEPPPPPPPPTPAVTFFGAESTLAGTSGRTQWQLFNESNHVFTMNWSLASGNGWPGFPIQGSVSLQASSGQIITVSVPVPDSAASDNHPLEMTVTRPDTLPPASSPGFIPVFH
jgi:hypothetical protein